MRVKFAFISIVVIPLIFSSCDFNVNDSPGPKMSSSIKEAQSHGTFLCAYKVDNNVINGIKVETIFAEKQYSRENGFLLKKRIECCKSQLIIISLTQPFSTQNSGFDVDWKLTGFETPSPYASIIYKDYKGVSLPDSVPITVIALQGTDSSHIIQTLKLYKIKS